MGTPMSQREVHFQATAVVASTEDAHPDAALLAAFSGYAKANRDFDYACDVLLPGGGSDQDHEPYYQALDSYSEVIERHQASTVEGLAVQLRYLSAKNMCSPDALRAAIYGEPVSDELAAALAANIYDKMLWDMAQRASTWAPPLRQRESNVHACVMEEATGLRGRIEAAVESLLALLDEMDGDADLEYTAGDPRGGHPDEAEPDDAPEEDDDCSDNADDEPWLGALEVSQNDEFSASLHPASGVSRIGRPPCDQEHAWSHGANGFPDLEWDINDRPHDCDEREADAGEQPEFDPAEDGIADRDALYLFIEERDFNTHMHEARHPRLVGTWWARQALVALPKARKRPGGWQRQAYSQRSALDRYEAKRY